MQGKARLLRSSILFFLFLGLSLPGSLLAADFTGTVIGVSDGDTITVLYQGYPEKIRLEGIDCPEKAQAFGQRAKQFKIKLHGSMSKGPPGRFRVSADNTFGLVGPH